MLYLLITITVRCYPPEPRVATDQLRTRALRRHLPERMYRMHTHNAGHFTFCGRLPRPFAGIALEDDTAPPCVVGDATRGSGGTTCAASTVPPLQAVAHVRRPCD